MVDDTPRAVEKVEAKAYTVPRAFKTDPAISEAIEREGGHVVKSQRMKEASPSRAISFDNDKQRNAQNINKGLAKPGYISYDTLRRASRSVHIVRICITVLKEKVSKTKWVVKPKDPLADKSDELKRQIDRISALLKKPNRNGDTWRSFIDKSLEDLYVCDAVSWEKTRFPNGEIAELYQVDSTTIHPVFNEYGQQNVKIPLPTVGGEETLPVSYLQVLNYSQYGGPQSGDIIAAWPKEDFCYFHMHPQGSLEGFGFGLSPIESVLSIVANLLNADNYNGTYFEEGAFPPVILQLIGQVNERDLEAYREYLMSELMGQFHRPAIMAGQTKAEVINLKDITNNDMQFMEYQNWLAKLMCAAYGLTAQDINLGERSGMGSGKEAETDKELSEGKGYTSTLELIKEQVNLIIENDFGFDEIEFDWVADDTINEKDLTDITDKRLRNGTITLNEVRDKFGEKRFGTWADKPAILTTDNTFVEVGPDSLLDPKEVQENEKSSDEESVITKSRKSSMRSLYVCRPVVNAEEIIEWAKSQGFGKTLQPGDMHVTIAYSTAPMDWTQVRGDGSELNVKGGERSVERLGDKGAIVLRFESLPLTQRWGSFCAAGASWDFSGYIPHISITYDGADVDLSKVQPYYGDIVFGPEQMGEIVEDFVEGVREKMIRKAVLTRSYRTCMDDYGYSQPFIYQNIMTGFGRVIKPPVAVNLMSQELEVELSQRISAKGVNVPMVTKTPYQDVIDQMPAEVLEQFRQYCDLGVGYDSEKWRGKIGPSRKFMYYLVQQYLDGYKLTNPLLFADMKRDPESYTQAVKDLAALWNVEKDMKLGDRRIDQYLITRDKRGWGFDYQFANDEDRWEASSDALPNFLKQIPELYEVFKKETSIAKSIRRTIGKMFSRAKTG